MGKTLCYLLMFLALSGCALWPFGSTTQPSTQPAVEAPIDDRPPVAAHDPIPDARILVCLEVYQLRVPFGTVSRSEQFWKHVNEQALDPGTYDSLIRNGIRVGTAPVSDWGYFRDLLARSPAQTQPLKYQGGDLSSVEISTKNDVEEQVIFYFNSKGLLEGREYERSQNVLCMEFAPLKRRPGVVNVRLCPLVRAWRMKFEPKVDDNGVVSYPYLHPERLYDVGLMADIPLENFLVVAPSAEAAWRTSVGHSFFVSDGPAGREELVLLVAPRPFRVEREKGVVVEPMVGR